MGQMLQEETIQTLSYLFGIINLVVWQDTSL